MYPCQLSHLCIPYGRSPAFSSWCYCIELYCILWKLMNNYIACALNPHTACLWNVKACTYYIVPHCSVIQSRHMERFLLHWQLIGCLNHWGNEAKPGTECSTSYFNQFHICPSLTDSTPRQLRTKCKAYLFGLPWATSTRQILQTMTHFSRGLKLKVVMDDS